MTWDKYWEWGSSTDKNHNFIGLRDHSQWSLDFCRLRKMFPIFWRLSAATLKNEARQKYLGSNPSSFQCKTQISTVNLGLAFKLHHLSEILKLKYLKNTQPLGSWVLATLIDQFHAEIENCRYVEQKLDIFCSGPWLFDRFGKSVEMWSSVVLLKCCSKKSESLDSEIVGNV